MKIHSQPPTPGFVQITCLWLWGLEDGKGLWLAEGMRGENEDFRGRAGQVGTATYGCGAG